MTTDPDPELVALTLRYQKDLPPEFFTDYMDVSTDLAVARRPAIYQDRGEAADALSTEKGWSVRLREAIFTEIHSLLCTNAPEYDDVRKAGQALSKPGVTAVAGAVSAAFTSVATGLITGAVAFFLLLIAKVGVRSFCRAYSGKPASPP